VFSHVGDCILRRVPIRTSATVTAGMVVLTLIGVATIFGNSIVATVAPPRVDETQAHGATNETRSKTVVVNPKQPPSPASASVAIPVPPSAPSGTGVDAR
jgi:hypothetical protein